MSEFYSENLFGEYIRETCCGYPIILDMSGINNKNFYFLGIGINLNDIEKELLYNALNKHRQNLDKTDVINFEINKKDIKILKNIKNKLDLFKGFYVPDNSECFDKTKASTLITEAKKAFDNIFFIKENFLYIMMEVDKIAINEVKTLDLRCEKTENIPINEDKTEQSSDLTELAEGEIQFYKDKNGLHYYKDNEINGVFINLTNTETKILKEITFNKKKVSELINSLKHSNTANVTTINSHIKNINKKFKKDSQLNKKIIKRSNNNEKYDFLIKLRSF